MTKITHGLHFMVSGIEHQFHMICRIFLFNLKTCSCYIIDLQEHNRYKQRVRVMVFNATFNNISVIVAFSFIGGENQNTTTDINKGLIVIYIHYSMKTLVRSVDHKILLWPHCPSVSPSYWS